MTITANQTLYGNGRPDLVGAFPTKGGQVTFNGTRSGNRLLLETEFIQRWPRIRNALAIASNLQSLCTLNAITDANGQVLLQNALPGAVPTMGLGSIIGPGRWRFDANISKAIRITESKALQFRLDATDVFNHAEPNAPSLNLTGTTATNFGLIAGKSDLHRMLQAQLRFSF